MIDETLSLVVPCRADEPDLGSTLESLLAASLSPQLPSGCVRELLVCINGVGPDRPCPEPSMNGIEGPVRRCWRSGIFVRVTRYRSGRLRSPPQSRLKRINGISPLRGLRGGEP